MRRILVADDSKPIRRVVELSLDDLDVEVKVAADGDQATEIVDAGFAPDIALLDVHMPGTGGLELCTGLRARFPELQVLMMAGTFEPFDPDAALQAGATGHLLKPFSADDLRRRVEELLSTDDSSGSGREPAVPSILTAPREEAGAHQEQVDETGPNGVSEDTQSADNSLGEEELPIMAGGEVAPNLSDVDLDRLAQKVAVYLADRLTPQNAEELFTRVAGEEVRRRIQQLEAELDEADD